MGVDRELRLAGDHLREAAKALAETPLRAEQASPAAAGAATEDSWVGWTSADEPVGRAGRDLKAEGQAVREMTPDEIRLDEVRQAIEWVGGDPWSEGPSDVAAVLKGLKHRAAELAPQAEQPSKAGWDENEIRADELKGIAERISLLVGQATAFGTAILSREVKAIIAGRIKALLPEQTSSEEVLDQMTGGRRDPGLRYRQNATSAIRLGDDDVATFFGSSHRIDVHSTAGPTTVPPYQVDQLNAIADGRPSWPATKEEPEVVTREENEAAQSVDHLTELLKTVGDTRRDINRVGGIEAGIEVLTLWSEDKGLLTEFSAALLADAVTDAVRGLLRE